MAVCVALGAYLDGKLSASGEAVWYYIVFLSVLVVRAGGFLAPGTQMGSEGVRGSHRGHARRSGVGCYDYVKRWSKWSYRVMEPLGPLLYP